MKTATPVVFRVWRRKPKFKGDIDVIALFPEILGRTGMVWSYEHVGQGGDAFYHLVVEKTRPAKPKEYRDLAKELRGLGYKFKVYKRWNFGRNRRINL